MLTDEYIEIEEQYGAHNYHPLDVVIDTRRVFGFTMWTANRYLDCLSAYSALNQGHVHPKILQALVEQAQKVTLTSRAFRNDQLPLLYKELSDLTGYEMSLPMNSGAEAVETALKLARKWAYQVKGVPRYQAEIITFENNFHGRTITIISFSTEPLYRDDFGPFTPGFIIVPYGDCSGQKSDHPQHCRHPVRADPGRSRRDYASRRLPAQLRQICEQKNVLLIADEIQTGLGRTGKLFACDHEGVRPDIMMIGKALAGGFYPVSAILADEPIMGLFQPGEHGSTFGGNPLAAALRVPPCA